MVVALAIILRAVWLMVRREALAIVIAEAVRNEEDDIDGRGRGPRNF